LVQLARRNSGGEGVGWVDGSLSAMRYPASRAAVMHPTQTFTVRVRRGVMRWAKRLDPKDDWTPQNAQVDMVSV
jgi:hypothetical protein